MRNRVCVEIGNNLLKIIVGSHRGNFKIDKYVDVNMTEKSGVDREDFDEILLSDVMTAAFQENKIPRKRVCLVLSCIPKLLLREIYLPIASRYETFKMIRYESQQFFPGEIQNYVLDFKLLSRDEEKNRQDLLIVAVPKKFIKKMLFACKTADIKVEKIDIEANALAKYVAHGFKDYEEMDNPGIIINMERSFVTAVVVKGGNLVMAKTFLAEFKSLYDKGVNRDLDTGVEAVEMAENISKFANFYTSRKHQNISWICFTGEMSEDKDLSELVKKRLDVPRLQSDEERLKVKSLAALAGGLI